MQGSAGAQESVKTMCAYELLRDDLDSLSELSIYPPKEDPFGKLESKVCCHLFSLCHFTHIFLLVAQDNSSL